MSVLVTGGAGYIGSHTCKALARAGHTPVVLDNLCTGHKELVRWGDFVHGDIRDTALLAATIKKFHITGIIHFAALSSVGESVAEPNRYYHNNVVGTHSILEAMLLTGIQHLVVSSTAAVYGQPEVIPMDEATPIAPINPYGASKSMMERMLDDYHTAFGISGAALRYFNAAGADSEGETGEWHMPETHLIPRALMAAFHDINGLQLFGTDYPTPDGTCIRDYIHVSDLAEAHILALQWMQQNNKPLTLNLGTGDGFSVQQIISTIETTTGHKVPIHISPRRAGDPPILVAKADKAQEVLGWTPQHSHLTHTIATAAHWYESIREQINR